MKENPGSAESAGKPRKRRINIRAYHEDPSSQEEEKSLTEKIRYCQKKAEKDFPDAELYVIHLDRVKNTSMIQPEIS